MERTAFAPGDLVHVSGVGKGVIREVRNAGRYLVEVNGRAIVTLADQLSAREASRPPARPRPVRSRRDPDLYTPRGEAATLDLHGKTAEEAVEAARDFLNQALLAGTAEIRFIHGRSGGKLKSALHAELRRVPAVRGFALDPGNPGVTIVRL